MHRLLVALLLLTGCTVVEVGRVPEPGRPGLALQAHDVSSGKLLWRKEVSPPVAATEPVLVGGVVLVRAGALVAYDARDGERLWALEGEGLPQVAGDVVVLQHERDVQAVEPRTGRSLWRVPVAQGARVHAGPGGVAVVEGASVRLLSLDGVSRWSVQVAGEPFAAHPGADVVAVAGLRADVVGLSAQDGRELWRTAAPAAPVVRVAQDRVLARQAGGVTAYDVRTGAELWRQPGGDGGGAPLQVTGDRVLVVDSGGTSRVLALADGRVVDQVRARDVELLGEGMVRAQLDELRYEGASSGWQTTVATGDRPALWTGADVDTVVAVAGWGQPPARD